MHSISELARRSEAPRRTVQYWYDAGLLVAEPSTADSARPLFNDDELALVRILLPVSLMAPIERLRSLATTLRYIVLGQFQNLPVEHHGGGSAKTIQKARQIAKRLREGKNVWLMVQITPPSSEWNADFATSAAELGMQVIRRSAKNPNCPIVIVALHEVLRSEAS